MGCWAGLERRNARVSGPKEDQDNRSDQLNPNNDSYWQSRCDEERPDDWEERTDDED